MGGVIKSFVLPPKSKIEHAAKIIINLMPLAQIFWGFQMHDLMTCKLKVQVVVSLGSYLVLFARGS